MQHAFRTSVRVLITTLSIATIVIGFSLGGNPLVHPVSGAGSIMIFIGVVVVFGYWSLAWCDWYSSLTVRQLAGSNTPMPHPVDVSERLGHEDGGSTADDVAFERTVFVQSR